MAKKETTVVEKSSVTITGSDSANIIDVIKVYGNSNKVKARNGNDRITVYKGKKHKIYGDDGKDTITAAKTAGTGNKLYGGAGNDTIKIQGGSKIYAYGGDGSDKITVSGGNKHVLTGGTGSDTYILSAAMKKETRLTVNQAGKESGDADILKLAKVNRDDVSFSYNSSKKVLTVTHKTGGTVSVKNWAVNPLSEIQFANKESVHVAAGSTGKKLNGTSGVDYILAESGNKTVKAGKGNDTVIVSGGSSSSINGGAGDDTLEINAGSSFTVKGDAGNDVIRIKGGSGHVINSGTGNDKIYVEAGLVKSLDNSGGNDYIEIGKNAGDGIKVESGASAALGYKLIADETVKVLGGNNHDIRLYGGNDKVIVAGGSGHVIYTDGPTGSGDAGGDDIIVIQGGGTVKKIVAGNGDDVIAVANGAGDGSVIYTGLEDPAAQNAGTGNNTVNLLGGSGHTVYLGGARNTVLIESQNVVLNTCKGTADDITVRWSEQGTGTLRINCANDYGKGTEKSTLRLEGVNSEDFSFGIGTVQIKNGSAYEGYASSSLIMKFTGAYERDTRNVNQVADTQGTVYYRFSLPDEPNNTEYTRLPVYVNTNGAVQYNWCQGNEKFEYDDTPVVTAEEMTETTGAAPVLEIARWGMHKAFGGITFDNGFRSFDQITEAAKNNTTLW